MGQQNLVRFEARQPQNGLPAVTIRDLLKAALRHRPDRIILGEIRGGEAFDLLQLLNTGHSGSPSTVHATSAKQALARFTSCVLQSGVDLPYRAIKTNIGDSLNVVVQLERRPGRRFFQRNVEMRRMRRKPDHWHWRRDTHSQKVRVRELLQPWHLRKRSLYPPRHSGGTIVGTPAARAASARGDRLHRGGIWPTATGRAFKHVERSRSPPPAKRATRRRDRAL